jgi:DNA-binding transcriptional LysR family regulator
VNAVCPVTCIWVRGPASSSVYAVVAGAKKRDARLQDPTPRSVLRIVSPRSSFAPILWPALEEFCNEHPGVQPDLQLDDGIGNWVLDRVDVGFRIGAPPEEGRIARPLFRIQLLISASPSYLERQGWPRSLDDLGGHRCSVFRHPAAGQTLRWYVNVEGEVIQRHVRPTVASNDIELEVHTALSGQVIAQVAAMSATPLAHAVRLVLEHQGVHDSHWAAIGSIGREISGTAKIESQLDF